MHVYRIKFGDGSFLNIRADDANKAYQKAFKIGEVTHMKCLR